MDPREKERIKLLKKIKREEILEAIAYEKTPEIVQLYDQIDRLESQLKSVEYDLKNKTLNPVHIEPKKRLILELIKQKKERINEIEKLQIAV